MAETCGRTSAGEPSLQYEEFKALQKMVTVSPDNSPKRKFSAEATIRTDLDKPILTGKDKSFASKTASLAGNDQQLRDEYTILREKHKRMQAENAKAILSMRKVMAQTAIASEDRIQELRQQMRNLKTENTGLKEKSSSNVASKDANKKIAQLEQALAEKMRQLAVAEERNAQVADASFNADISHKLTELETTLSKKTLELSLAEEKNAQMSQLALSAGEQEDRITQLEETLSKKELELEVAKRKNLQIRPLDFNAQELADKVTQLEQILSKKTLELAIAEEKHSERTHLAGNAEELADKVTQLEEALALKSQEVAAAQERNDVHSVDLMDKVTQLEKQLSSKTQELEDAEKKMRQLVFNSGELSVKVSQLEDITSKKQLELSVCEEKNARMRQLVANSEERLAGKVTQLEESLSTKKQELAIAEGKISALQTQLNGLESSGVKHQAETKLKREYLENAEKTISSLEQGKEELQRELREKAEQVNKLEQYLEGDDKSGVSEDDDADEGATSQNLRSKLAQLRFALDRRDEEKKEVESTTSGLETENAKLASSLAHVESERTKLQTKLDEQTKAAKEKMQEDQRAMSLLLSKLDDAESALFNATSELELKEKHIEEAKYGLKAEHLTDEKKKDEHIVELKQAKTKLEASIQKMRATHEEELFEKELLLDGLRRQHISLSKAVEELQRQTEKGPVGSFVQPAADAVDRFFRCHEETEFDEAIERIQRKKGRKGYTSVSC